MSDNNPFHGFLLHGKLDGDSGSPSPRLKQSVLFRSHRKKESVHCFILASTLSVVAAKLPVAISGMLCIYAVPRWKGIDMARPKKNEELSKQHRITIRFTDTEYELICGRAKESGMTLSEYIRKMLIDGKFVCKYEVVADMPELQKLTTEFAKIGGNLNQIARYFNMGGLRSQAIQEDIHKGIACIFELRKEVIQMAGDYHGNSETHRK